MVAHAEQEEALACLKAVAEALMPKGEWPREEALGASRLGCIRCRDGREATAPPVLVATLREDLLGRRGLLQVMLAALPRRLEHHTKGRGAYLGT